MINYSFFFILDFNISRTSSYEDIFHASKVEYETPLKNSGYKNIDFKYDLENKNNNRQNTQRNITWFNLPFSQAVSTNVAKRFLDLLDKHSLPNNQLHKILNRNTVNISYSYTPNVSSIIKSHNKKLINAENKQLTDCNCRKNEEHLLNGKCRSENITYKCVVTATGHP